MPKLSRRTFYWGGGILLTALIGCTVIIWKASTELMSPARRALQPYHRDWLERPGEHGVAILAFTALQGQVPCLLVTPNAAAGLSPRGERVRQQLTDQGVALPAFGTTFGNLVLLHGRNGRKEDLLPVAERFCAVGFRCVLPDLPAHGESPRPVVYFGESDFEATLPANVLEVAVTRFALPRDPAGLWGMSMGGAFLARAAAQPEAPWKALVVVCSFGSLDAVVARKSTAYAGPAAPLFKRLVEALCVARGGIDPATVQPAQWASRITTPVFVAHGDRDILIPLSQGEQLFAAYASPEKTWTVVKGGSHNTILITEHPLYAEMARWYLKYLRGGR